MRSFVAIMVDKRIKQLVQQIITELRWLPHTQVIRWMNLEKLHLTLQFLGDLNPEQLVYMLQQLPLAVRKLTNFVIKPSHIELFPSTGRPIVIALRFKPEAKLDQLADLVKGVAVEAGVNLSSRPFWPHLTLGRLKAQPYPLINDIIIPHEQVFAIKQVTLLESKPQTSGSLYIPIQSFYLAKP